MQQTAQADLFIQQLRDALRRETRDSRALKIAKHMNVYTCGEAADTVYFIDRGQIKLVTVTYEGKECLFAIHGAGEIFGELSLSGSGERLETAIAMEETDLKVIPTAKFFELLRQHSLLEGLVRYLAVRIADQQELISQLVTAGSEHRLGTTLLELARKIGKRSPGGLRIEHWITHEELSEMVGTTRPRVSLFMQRFHELGLIETSATHGLVVRDQDLSNYLTLLAS